MSYQLKFLVILYKSYPDQILPDMLEISEMTNGDFPRFLAFGILLLLSVYFSVDAFLVTFTSYGPHSCYIDLSSKLKVDIRDLCVGSMRIISIFACKQTLCYILKDRKSTLINKSVEVIWI